MDQALNHALAQFASDPEKQEFAEIFKEKWGKGEPVEIVVAIYVKHLTIEEMQALIKFYRSPTGRKFVEKQPLIVQELMTAGQTLGQQTMERALMRVQQLPIALADPQTPLSNLRHQLAQAVTARKMKHLGTAMMQWTIDQVEKGVTTWSPDASKKPRPQWHVTDADGNRAVFRVVSYKTMTKLLVPTYIDAVPKEDGWGHPYQFAINDLLEINVLGIRSSGQDGVFETSYHKCVSFAYKEYHQDIVWGGRRPSETADGYSTMTRKRREETERR